MKTIDYKEFTGFQGNPRLRRPNMNVPLTNYQVEEISKCIDDPVYFAENYIKIIHVDKGIIPFEMWDFQKEMINQFVGERFNIAKLPRQCGKCFFINTPIRLRNKKTGEEVTMTIGEFFDLAKKQSETDKPVRKENPRNRKTNRKRRKRGT